MKRWTVIIHYRGRQGVLDVMYKVDRLHEIDLILMQGPSYRTIESIEIRNECPEMAGYTVEDEADQKPVGSRR